MGKRELLLIVAFLVLGGIVYQVSAPDRPADGEGRSFMDFFRRVRGEMVGSRARFPVDLPVKAAVGDDVATLDLGELAGRVEIVGEAREDIEGAAVATLLGENETDVKGAAPGAQARDRNGRRYVSACGSRTRTSGDSVGTPARRSISG